MNQLLPKYSFIKNCIPHAKNYQNNLYKYIDINYTNYYDKFKINNINIQTSIFIRNHRQNDIDYNIITSTIFKHDNKLINENINIEYDKSTYHIKYKLNDESIVIPKFKIEKDNYKLLLDYYKFIGDDHIKLLGIIQ
jgi:hypothetical protein